MSQRLILLILSVGFTVSQAFAAQCPNEVVLSDARFIHHQSFPTSEQIKTNFDQAFLYHSSIVLYDQDELKAAQNFVSALQANEVGGAIVLHPLQCRGELGGVPFTVGPDAIEFTTSENTAVDIAIGERVPVEFQIFFPSNCSGCPHSAELLDFGSVRISR